jgi:hypothetical protein
MYVNLGYCHINIIYDLEISFTKKPAQSITMIFRDVSKFRLHRSFKYNNVKVNA